MRYWVIGGVYASTDFDRLVGGGEEERLGPFRRYEDAVDEWRSRAWATVDNCHARYRIISDQDDG